MMSCICLEFKYRFDFIKNVNAAALRPEARPHKKTSWTHRRFPLDFVSFNRRTPFIFNLKFSIFNANSIDSRKTSARGQSSIVVKINQWDLLLLSWQQKNPSQQSTTHSLQGLDGPPRQVPNDPEETGSRTQLIKRVTYPRSFQKNDRLGK